MTQGHSRNALLQQYGPKPLLYLLFLSTKIVLRRVKVHARLVVCQTRVTARVSLEAPKTRPVLDPVPDFSFSILWLVTAGITSVLHCPRLIHVPIMYI